LRPNAFGGEYLELVPNTLLRYTEVRITQAGIPEVIPVEMCYLGWQESLAELALLVEPQIADS